MKLEPLPAAKALDSYYLDARARLLDLAAIFDRIDRGGQVADPRLDRLRSGLQILADKDRHRAARVQELFSDH
ncbi:MAG: hypothetical protein ACJ8C4_17770 [Gemmataceae bacterium]